jgi:hypothetical protein
MKFSESSVQLYCAGRRGVMDDTLAHANTSSEVAGKANGTNNINNSTTKPTNGVTNGTTTINEAKRLKLKEKKKKKKKKKKTPVVKSNQEENKVCIC